MASNEWIHERFATLLGFSEDTSVDFILMIGTFICVNDYLILFLYKLEKRSIIMKFLKRSQILDFRNQRKPVHLRTISSKNIPRIINLNQ